MKISKDQDLVEKTLRLPRDLSEEIKLTAKAHDRSANAEMVERLRAAPVADEVARLAGEIAELKALVRQLLVSVG
jgi:plasmid stability protein